MAIIRSMHTEAINHEPAITFIQTGRQVAGRPCIGSWLAYGLGSMNQDLPTFVVMNAEKSHPQGGRASHLSASLERRVSLGKVRRCRFAKRRRPRALRQEPRGRPRSTSGGECWTGLNEMNQIQHQKIGDPETLARIEQFEMAFRMQSSVPEMSDLSSEPESTFKRWGEDAREPGKFANAALRARRLIERGVRFVQIYHRGWDVHNRCPLVLPFQCKDIDRAAWALVQDLKERGLFDETLVIWGGEFGRTIYSQGKLTATDFGRDHHPRCFSVWMAGGGGQRRGRLRRNGRFFLQHRQGPRTYPRLSGDDSAPVRHRPRTLHLQAPGPRREADRRRAGPRGESGSGVVRPKILQVSRLGGTPDGVNQWFLPP